MKYVGYGVHSPEGVTFISDPHRFNPVDGGHRKIYRRKPKPFKFPKNFGAVILLETEDASVKFVKSDVAWHHGDTGTSYWENEFEGYFPKAKYSVLSEGLAG